MNPIAPTGREATHKVARLRIGIRRLLVLVASCVLIMWAGLSIRDHLEEYQPLRVIRSGNTSERRKAAIELSGRGDDDTDAMITAFIDAFRDDLPSVDHRGPRSFRQGCVCGEPQASRLSSRIPAGVNRDGITKSLSVIEGQSQPNASGEQ